MNAEAYTVSVLPVSERLGAHQIVKDADVLVRLHAVTIAMAHYSISSEAAGMKFRNV